jgi:hypothetical protein
MVARFKLASRKLRRRDGVGLLNNCEPLEFFDKIPGVFNGPRRIPRGTFLGIYAGELLTDEQGEDRGR